ncbi:GTP-binding protein [Planctomycetota bacterium]
MENLKIVVAGHIDHGKSTLIGRLLYETDSLSQRITDEIEKLKQSGAKQEFAFITDQLKEEQANGITIDTTQVELKTSSRYYRLIDTPGHREFLKNMITGATTAAAAIVVIDISEGLMEQTYQHIYLIAMLGIKQVIVVINKMDQKLYNRIRFWELSEQIKDHLNKLNMQITAVIPVSAQYGDNITIQSRRMDWNSSPTLIKSLDLLSCQNGLGQSPLRFVVQCPFITKSKTTILGKMVSGRVFKNQHITFGPDHHVTKVLSIEAGGRERTSAQAPESIALTLDNSNDIYRGQVGFNVCHPPITTDSLKANVFSISTEPLKPTDKITILCGTQQSSAKIEEITRIIDPTSLKVIATDAERIADSQVATVKIKLDRPICVDPFDKIAELGRFAIVRNGKIAGGGIIK